MPRIIEIVLFLIPFLSFAVWRLVFPSPLPPLWLICVLTAFVVLLLVALIWLRHVDAGDANQPYLPDQLENGRVIPAQPSARP